MAACNLVQSTEANGLFQGCEKLPYCIAVVPLLATDSSIANAIGALLYKQLTRDPTNPLSSGAGIPVVTNPIPGWERVPEDDLSETRRRLEALADNVLLVIIAGTNSVLLSPDQSRSRISRLARDLAPVNQRPVNQRPVDTLLLATDARWQVEAQPLRSVLTVADAVIRSNQIDLAVDEVLLAAGAQLSRINGTSKSPPERSLGKPRLLITEDLLGSAQLSTAQQCQLGLLQQPMVIHHYFSSIQSSGPLGREQFSEHRDSSDVVLLTGQSVAEQESRFWQRDTILALQLGWPVLTLATSDRRSSGLVEMARAAATEHLRHLHFMVIARRLIARTHLPSDTAVLSRAPMLLDFSSGVLSHSHSRLLLHPDPVLTPQQRDLLRAAAPRVSILTPSTLLARNDSASGRLTSPLDSLRIGISASSMEASEFAAGRSALHLEDALVQIARNLITGGATLAFGDDFSFRDTMSLTPILARLSESYGQTLRHGRICLQMYQPADGDLSQIPEEVFCHVRHLAYSEDLNPPAVFSALEVSDLPEGMKYSDMRRVMNANCDARVVIGGQVRPRSEVSSGFVGRFPGVAEETYRALVANQPVYLCGGFGGMAGRLARLMEAGTVLDSAVIDASWDERSEDGNLRFADLKYRFDSHSKRQHLELPRDLRELAIKIVEIIEAKGKYKETWLDFNGLTYEQNVMLWHCTDPTLISGLIAHGLIKWRSRNSQLSNRIRIEAVKGDIGSITDIDLLAVPVFDDIAPQGAGAAIDRITGGLVTQLQSSPGRLVGIRSAGLDADYIYIVSLGKFNEFQSGLNERIRAAAAAIGQFCQREGFRSLGVVTFAGSVDSMHSMAVGEMLAGFQSQSSDVVIKWVEYDTDRYQQLVDILRASDQVELTTQVKSLGNSTHLANRYPWFSLNVILRGEELEVSGLPQESGGAIWARQAKLSAIDLDQLTKGVGPSGKATPGIPELVKRGKQLAEILFGPHLEPMQRLLQQSPLAISHNSEASKIPFELLRLTDSNDWMQGLPAITTGVHRWLKTVGGPLSFGSLSFGSIQTQPTYPLRVGLIIDPLGDLPGARREGEAINRVLGSLSDRVRFTVLGYQHDAATKDAVLQMITSVDILHYCGHAIFRDSHPDKSALVLAKREKLTAKELQSLVRVPRIVIFNACQAGRVRSMESTEWATHASHSLAEVILRTGVEAFVGTYWEVEDTAAEKFAETMYRELAAGVTLRESVTRGRHRLAEEVEKDWANYMLYGDGRFRLG